MRVGEFGDVIVDRVAVLEVGHTWDGDERNEKATVRIEVGREVLVLVDAPYFGDPVPEGKEWHPRLWEFEVVELFLAEGRGSDSRYWELELGPHGHYLALAFDGYRERKEGQLSLDVSAERYRQGDAERWRGRAIIPREWVATSGYCNAYMIHGSGQREYCAAHPVQKGLYPGPDFHRLAHFEPLQWASRRPDVAEGTQKP